MRQRVRDAIYAQNSVELWNATHFVGQRVSVRRDNGSVTSTTTRSEAQISSGGQAVIFLDGIAGYYLLDRVKAD